MSLKRGLERSSCDHCHRRKIKCDRPVRLQQGNSACSQCTTRKIPCALESFNQERSANSDRTLPPPAPPISPLGGDATGAWAASNQHADQVSVGVEASSTALLSEHHCNTAAWGQMGASGNHYEHLSGFDPLAGLSTSSIEFLETISMDQPDWSVSGGWIFAGDTLAHIQPSLSLQDRHDTINTTAFGGQIDTAYQISGVSQAVLHSAIEKYFEIVAPSLPVLVERAFWSDFQRGISSPALVFAVACRGIPFTDEHNRRHLESALAGGFRRAILERQCENKEGQSMPVDDLEALALMVDFKYGETSAGNLEKRLERMLLTHDSLVLMVMQYQKERSDVDGSLTDANERCLLLFWHVFGLDAFRNLDRKTYSRIQDDPDEPYSPTDYVVGSYLNAILSLAISARKISHGLCGYSAKRTGISSRRIKTVYESLLEWRRTTYKPWCLSNDLDEGTGRKNDDVLTRVVSRTEELQAAVLRALEANCYLQIESHVQAFGLKDKASLEAEAMSSLIQHRTLDAVREVISIAKHTLAIRDSADEETPWTDAFPNVLRDICAGTCVWLCLRGQGYHTAQPESESGQGTRNATMLDIRVDSSDSLEQERIRTYAFEASILRDAVACAKSHSDTPAITMRLASHVEALKNLDTAARVTLTSAQARRRP